MLTSATVLWSDFIPCFLTSSLPMRHCFSLTIWFSLNIKDWIVFTPIKSHPVTLCPEQMTAEAWVLQGNLLLAATQAFGRASWASSHCLLSSLWLTARLGSTKAVLVALPGSPECCLSVGAIAQVSPARLGVLFLVSWNAGDMDWIIGYLVPLRNRSQVPKHLVLN